ncbi:MAG: hypothetical protein ACI8RZ_005355 [Myxococcota bacterium]|jgi:hypothetical protein
MRVQHRLQRRIIGERLHRSRAIEVRAEERQSRKGAPIVELPERYGGMTFTVRNIRGMVTPEPNAPQLIRLVRYPFALDRGSFSRSKTTDFSLVRSQRRPYREGFEAAMELAQRPAWSKPSQARQRLQPRPRPSLDAWLAGEEGGRNG